MVQLRNAVFACFWFSLSNGLTSGDTDTSGPKSVHFNFGGTGQVDFVATKTDNKTGYVGANGGYGFVNFKYQNNKKGSEAKFFMDGFDPSNFIQTGQANADQSKPTELQFAVEGNLSVTLEDVQLRCPIRIGLRSSSHDKWYLGGPDCVKGKADAQNPGPGRPGLFNLECECDNATRIMFTMKESQKKSKSNTVKTEISDCSAIAAKNGYWAEVGSSPGTSQVQLSYGVQRSYTVRKTRAWGHSTTHSVSAGFKFGGKAGGIGASVDISHTTSRDFSNEHSNTFSTSEMTTFSTMLPAGVIYQFKMNVDDNCGTSGVHMNDFVVTTGATEPPCCLPGYFVNVSEPHGDCITSDDGDNYNVCDLQRALEDPTLV